MPADPRRDGGESIGRMKLRRTPLAVLAQVGTLRQIDHYAHSDPAAIVVFYRKVDFTYIELLTLAETRCGATPSSPSQRDRIGSMSFWLVFAIMIVIGGPDRVPVRGALDDDRSVIGSATVPRQRRTRHTTTFRRGPAPTPHRLVSIIVTSHRWGSVTLIWPRFIYSIMPSSLPRVALQRSALYRKDA